MFNFLVTAENGAWDLPSYEYECGRFGEYSSTKVMERFKSLSPEAIEELKSFPALFAYEGDTENVRVGYIRRIKERNNLIYIEYEFETGIPEIPFSNIAPLKKKLDIREYERGIGEMDRTHWAVKDEDLFDILFEAGLIDQTFLHSIWQLGKVEDLKFKVALSFPGERREYVSEVAAALKRRLPRGSVFYDKDFTAELARPNLDTLLQRIYGHNSDLVVIFLSKEYEEKEWCGLEWRAIRQILMDRNKSDRSIMFLRFDYTSIDGVFSHDGYIDLNACSPTETANFIIQRVTSNRNESLSKEVKTVSKSINILLTHYLEEQNREAQGNAFRINFQEADRQLGFEPNTTAEHLESIAAERNFEIQTRTATIAQLHRKDFPPTLV